jgi:hypothetical protein
MGVEDPLCLHVPKQGISVSTLNALIMFNSHGNALQRCAMKRPTLKYLREMAQGWIGPSRQGSGGVPPAGLDRP